jgi:hypothetical protein
MNSTRIGTLLWAIMMFFLLTLLFGDHSGTFRRGRSKNRVVRSAAWGFCKRRDFGRLSPKSDLKAELEQLTMDARRSPQRIVDAHPPDQRAQVRVDLRPASKRAGFPTPIPTEASPMPTDKGFGPDDRDRFQDRWKPSIQLDQEQPIPHS